MSNEPKAEPPEHPASCECEGTGSIEMGDPTDSTVENWLEPCPFDPEEVSSMGLIERDQGMPTTIWLCPSHFPYAYVDHGGTCPEGGCTREMVPYTQQPRGVVATRDYLQAEIGRMRRVLDEDMGAWDDFCTEYAKRYPPVGGQ